MDLVVCCAMWRSSLGESGVLVQLCLRDCVRSSICEWLDLSLPKSSLVGSRTHHAFSGRAQRNFRVVGRRVSRPLSGALQIAL